MQRRLCGDAVPVGVSAFIPLASIGWVGFRGSAVSSTTLHEFVIYFFLLFKLVFSRCLCI